MKRRLRVALDAALLLAPRARARPPPVRTPPRSATGVVLLRSSRHAYVTSSTSDAAAAFSRE